MLSMDVVKALLANAAIISSGIYVMGRFLPLGSEDKPFNYKKVIGTTIISSASILFPIKYQSGILIDLRQVPVCILGFISGIVPALISSVIPGLLRLYMGGAGALPGALFMCFLPAVAGGLLNIYCRSRNGGIQSIIGSYKYLYLLLMSAVSWFLVFIPLNYIILGGREVLREIAEVYFLVLVGAYFLAGVVVNDCIKSDNYKQRLEYEASTDYTTTLMNLRYFMKKAGERFQRLKQEGKGAAVILIDIDDFKLFNDINGHLRGDKLLAQISGLLLRNTRDRDIVARYGGEEFIIFMEDTSVSLGRNIAERIRKQIEGFVFVKDGGIGGEGITISIGVAGFPKHGQSLTDIIDKADMALYRAKGQGKNRVVVCRE